MGVCILTIQRPGVMHKTFVIPSNRVFSCEMLITKCQKDFGHHFLSLLQSQVTSILIRVSNYPFCALGPRKHRRYLRPQFTNNLINIYMNSKIRHILVLFDFFPHELIMVMKSIDAQRRLMNQDLGLTHLKMVCVPNMHLRTILFVLYIMLFAMVCCFP
jgi:hypothetical protein